MEKKGKWMRCSNNISRRKVRLLSKSGNVNGGNSTKPMCQ